MNALRFLLPALGLLGACANSPTPAYDAKFGDAVREARQRQTLDPQAGLRGPATHGIGGVPGRDALLLYQRTFKEPPPVVNIINIGGAGAPAR